MSVTSRDRLSGYARIASVAGIGSTAGLGSAAVADTYDFSSSTPQTVSGYTSTSWNSSSVAAFTMGSAQGGIALNFFAAAASSTSFYSWGFKIPNSDRSNFINGPAGEPIFRLGGSQSIIISQGMTGGSNTWAISGSSFLAGAPSTGYLGFSIAEMDSSRNPTGNVFNGFLEYTFTLTESAAILTVNQWAYNVNSAITMPANGGGGGGGGGGAVPGLGGLAALACGAAGMRRNRQRVA